MVPTNTLPFPELIQNWVSLPSWMPPSKSTMIVASCPPSSSATVASEIIPPAVSPLIIIQYQPSPPGVPNGWFVIRLVHA